MPDSLAAATDVALAYQAATKTITGRLSTILATLWRQAHPWTVQADWEQRLPEAVGAFTAAQDAAAGMADGYVSAALAAQGSTTAGGLVVDPAAFAGRAASGLSLENLLSIPAYRAQQAVLGGMHPNLAMQAGEGSLRMYAATETADAARAASQVAATTRGVKKYMRVTGPLCCGRCAILSGRLYRVAEFDRHPNDRCGMLPVDDPAAAEVPDPMTLYREGRITGLSKAEREALDMGADLSQVVNARDGMYTAGGRRYTTAGTTIRGVAGARLTAAAMDRSNGRPAGLYTNFTVSRTQVAQAASRYTGLMRRGAPFRRVGPAGVTTAAYSRAGTPRRSVSQILTDHPDREAATTALINEGYVLRVSDAAQSTTSLERMLRSG